MRENPKTQDSTCDLPYLFFLCFYQKSNMILWSIRTFWYKGSAENKKKKHVHEKSMSLNEISLKLEVLFFKKV